MVHIKLPCLITKWQFMVISVVVGDGTALMMMLRQ
jgi:hypothetical protein